MVIRAAHRSLVHGFGNVIECGPQRVEARRWAVRYTALVLDNPDHAGFLIFAFIMAVIAVALVLVAAQWLLNRGFGPGAVAGSSSASGMYCAAPLEAGYFYLLARHSVDLRWRIEFESGNLEDEIGRAHV